MILIFQVWRSCKGAQTALQAAPIFNSIGASSFMAIAIWLDVREMRVQDRQEVSGEGLVAAPSQRCETP
jgi:hypothetical protein